LRRAPALEDSTRSALVNAFLALRSHQLGTQDDTSAEAGQEQLLEGWQSRPRRVGEAQPAENDGGERRVHQEVSGSGSAENDPVGLVTKTADQLGGRSQDGQAGRSHIEKHILGKSDQVELIQSARTPALADKVLRLQNAGRRTGSGAIAVEFRVGSHEVIVGDRVSLHDEDRTTRREAQRRSQCFVELHPHFSGEVDDM
jgi:hypothetical protein